jgi:hypothetical protein
LPISHQLHRKKKRNKPLFAAKSANSSNKKARSYDLAFLFAAKALPQNKEKSQDKQEP